jgi:O-antigen biosynthesis protein WbqP
MQNESFSSIGKRAFDLLVSLLAAPFALVLCGLMAIPIALESRASPFFLQWRLGQHEKQFRILKLRTMHIHAPTRASHMVGSEFVLKTGKIARLTKIDELPQLWNVLAGRMSLVGPRPGLPSQTELTNERRANGVFALKPGITGVSQIAGLDMSTPKALAIFDATYPKEWSAMRDLKILCLTALGNGQGDAANKSST